MTLSHQSGSVRKRRAGLLPEVLTEVDWVTTGNSQRPLRALFQQTHPLDMYQ